MIACGGAKSQRCTISYMRLDTPSLVDIASDIPDFPSQAQTSMRSSIKLHGDKYFTVQGLLT